MADNPTKWSAIVQALDSYLDTELNALANNVFKVGAAIDNTSNRCTHMDIALKLASLDLSAQSNPSVPIYMFESIDGGTLYDTSEDGVSAASDVPTQDKVITNLGLRIDTAAEVKYAVKTGLIIAPGHFLLGLRNLTGVAFGATLNVLYYRTYNLNLVTA